ncbi:MAG: hypothetical protein DDT23_01353 [candidate division WS2 bacterium]|nr:hypothetical protein [Candidatus Lithacetigena glycinireducens]
MKDIRIEPILNGWLCVVGCSRIGFLDRQVMLKELERYLLDPVAVEKEYLEKAINAPIPPVITEIAIDSVAREVGRR